MNNFQIIIQGDSMSPLILSGDELTVEKAHHYHIGDIIVFRDQMKVYVVHRIIATTPLTTKGDYSTLKEIVNDEAIFGKVISIKKESSEISLVSKGFYMRIYSYLSRMRLRGSILRKFSLLLLHGFTIVFLLIYSRPKKNHI